MTEPTSHCFTVSPTITKTEQYPEWARTTAIDPGCASVAFQVEEVFILALQHEQEKPTSFCDSDFVNLRNLHKLCPERYGRVYDRLSQ